MARLSSYATKLLAYFNLYQITPSEYDAHLSYHPKTTRRGVFGAAFQELLDEGY